jgi:hypothetical protein
VLATRGQPVGLGLAQLLFRHRARAGTQLGGAGLGLAQRGARLLDRRARLLVAQAREHAARRHLVALPHRHGSDHAGHLRTHLHPRGGDDAAGGSHGDGEIALGDFHHTGADAHEQCDTVGDGGQDRDGS